MFILTASDSADSLPIDCLLLYSFALMSEET